MKKAERIEYIGAELAAGRTLREIGDAVGVSHQRVQQIAKEFGFKRTRTPKAKPARRGRKLMYQEIRSACIAKGLPDPYRRFQVQRSRARGRGIAFALTFPQWWELWESHYQDRGVKQGGKVMCRELDAGGYDLRNVRIDTVRANIVEARLVQKMAHCQQWDNGNRVQKHGVWLGDSKPWPENPCRALQRSRGELEGD